MDPMIYGGMPLPDPFKQEAFELKMQRSILCIDQQTRVSKLDPFHIPHFYNQSSFIH